jgi:hypothetical protein
VLQEILHKIDIGTRVIYVPGNHDEVFRSYCGRKFSGVELRREALRDQDGSRTIFRLYRSRPSGSRMCNECMAFHSRDDEWQACGEYQAIQDCLEAYERGCPTAAEI